MDIRDPAVLDRIASYIANKYFVHSDKSIILFISSVTILLCPDEFYNDYIPYILQLTRRMLSYRTEVNQTEAEFHAKVDMIPHYISGTTCKERYDSLIKFYTKPSS